MRRGLLIVAQPVAGQRQPVDGVDHIIGKQAGVLVAGILFGDFETDCLGHARREVGAGAVRELQIFARALRIELGVVLLDEAAGAADEIEPHEVAPIVGVLAFLECSERPDRTLMTADKLRLADFAKQPLGANADILLLVDKQAELVREVEIRLVVGRRGKEDYAAVVGGDILGDRAVAAALAVAQIVAFIDQDQTVAAQIRQFSLNLCDRQNVCAEPVFLFVVLPHVDQILGADDERLDTVIILKNTGERRRH
ncbi:MAG: hypothetical protein BWX70_02640 [Verrucomicrobia bacterium ADurb.Bin070]|nr:MAG: hypothetical protein BWX70_02640 [Verrucomicrobia bacterium ADurb.Bin070]